MHVCCLPINMAERDSGISRPGVGGGEVARLQRVLVTKQEQGNGPWPSTTMSCVSFAI